MTESGMGCYLDFIYEDTQHLEREEILVLKRMLASYPVYKKPFDSKFEAESALLLIQPDFDYMLEVYKGGIISTK
ncbi:MAG TPA: hypothetical protein ENJ60_10605 [Aeromonadales bacterium]|nr:hypothetical protein [Aeromonadales bacterium]